MIVKTTTTQTEENESTRIIDAEVELNGRDKDDPEVAWEGLAEIALIEMKEHINNRQESSSSIIDQVAQRVSEIWNGIFGSEEDVPVIDLTKDSSTESDTSNEDHITNNNADSTMPHDFGLNMHNPACRELHEILSAGKPQIDVTADTPRNWPGVVNPSPADQNPWDQTNSYSVCGGPQDAQSNRSAACNKYVSCLADEDLNDDCSCTPKSDGFKVLLNTNQTQCIAMRCTPDGICACAP